MGELDCMINNKIQTVCGEIYPKQLGHCQMHEHIFVRYTPAADANSALCFDDEAKSIKELQDYYRSGGTTMIDAQPWSAGRDIQALARLSRVSGVQIVASTGYHLLAFYSPDHWIHFADQHQLTDLFIRELTSGAECQDFRMIDPDLKAGIVKAAIPAEGPAGRYEILLRSAAQAAAFTGVPLLMHTEKGKNAIPAIRICVEEGLQTGHIVICHADRQAEDFSVHEEIAATGVFLDYDTIHRLAYHDDQQECRLISHMIEAGYCSKILLSLDTTAKRLRSYGGEIGLDYLLTTFLDQLLSFGISEENLHRMMRENPVRVFSS